MHHCNWTPIAGKRTDRQVLSKPFRVRFRFVSSLIKVGILCEGLAETCISFLSSYLLRGSRLFSGATQSNVSRRTKVCFKTPTSFGIPPDGFSSVSLSAVLLLIRLMLNKNMSHYSAKHIWLLCIFIRLLLCYSVRSLIIYLILSNLSRISS